VPTRPARRQIVVLAALSAFGPLSLDMYLPGLPSLTRELHATAPAAQLTITACMLGLGVGQLIAVPVCAPLIGGQVLPITSWRGVFVILAALGVPLLVATATLLPETLPVEERHRGGLRVIVGTFGRLLGDRGFSPYAFAFALSFAYIAGSSFVLEDIYHLSPQLFSLIFAINSAGLIALTLIGGRLVGRIGTATLLRRGLFGTFAASVCTLLVVVSHAGLAWLLVCFFVLLASNGIVLPNGTAAAMGSGQPALGAASALLGLGQFGLGAVVAPLVGVAGSHDALPMAIVIAVAGTAAIGALLGAERPLHDLLHAAGAERNGHAEADPVDPVLALQHHRRGPQLVAAPRQGAHHPRDPQPRGPCR
jgi:DHA1 family bicyclomycin/chloramphenicol resistance-like MFS transporter